MVVLTLEELMAQEITRALFLKKIMDKSDMEREIIKQLKKFRDYDTTTTSTTATSSKGLE